MKVIGNKDKGYQIVSSFGQVKSEKAKKPGKNGKPENTNTPPEGGTTGPDKGGKEE